jgi:iron complex transport system substrate-binding protein
MSFSPALTEVLFAVCHDSQIVAVSPVCNYPIGTKNKPIVENYPVDQEAVLQVAPDLIFTEEGITPLDVAEQLKSLGHPVYYQRYTTVNDLLNKIDSIGTWLGNSQKAKKLTDSLRKEITNLENLPFFGDTAKALVITWNQPIFVHGKNTITTDKLKLAGAKNAVDQVFDKVYPELTREYILAVNPNVLFGGTFDHMDSTFFSLYPELKVIDAYKNRHIYALTDDLITRPSPRVLESVMEIKHYLNLYYQTKPNRANGH